MSNWPRFVNTLGSRHKKQSALERRVLDLEKEIKDKDQRIANLATLCPCQDNVVAVLQSAVDSLRKPPEVLVVSTNELQPAGTVADVHASTSTLDDCVSHVDLSASPTGYIHTYIEEKESRRSDTCT